MYLRGDNQVTITRQYRKKTMARDGQKGRWRQGSGVGVPYGQVAERPWAPLLRG